MKTYDIPMSQVLEALKKAELIPNDDTIITDGWHSPSVKFNTTSNMENVLVIKSLEKEE
jgi:hypothetical protein